MKASFDIGKVFFLAIVFSLAFVAHNSYAATVPGACTVEDLFTDIAATENCVIRKEEENNAANQDGKTCGKYTTDSKNQPGGGGEIFISIKVFSAIICRVVQLTRDIAGTMWCGISNALIEPLQLLITLFVTVLGIMFTIGTLQPSGAQLMLNVFKIAMVYGLATDGTLAIQWGYNFFMSAATDGISIVLTHSSEGGPAVTPKTMIDGLDEIFTSVFFSNAPLEQSKEAMSVFAGYAGIASAVPMGVTLGAFLMLTVFYSLFVFFKAVMTYLFAITGITFLTAMMPIFLCFALFRTTSGIFWGWLGALVSFTIQPIILFAFLILIQGHLRDSLDELACLVQERISVDPNGQYNSDGTLISLLDTNKYHLTQGKCVIGSSPTSPECQTVDPYQQWDNSMEFLNDTMIPIISSLILLVLTNTFLGFVPEIAQHLAGGMSGGAAPAIGGSAYSKQFGVGNYNIRHGLFDSVDNFMARFNTTAGQSDADNSGFLRNPLTTMRDKEVRDREKLEINPEAFANQAVSDQMNMMKTLGINDISARQRAGMNVYNDRAMYAKNAGFEDSGASDDESGG